MSVRGRKQAGDTIIEVLMAIVVVSFMLVAAYVTVNKNTATNQETQERSQATQLATTQLEFLHVSSLGSFNCFDSTGTPAGTVADNSACVVNSDGSKNTTGSQPKYTIAITQPSAGTYQVSVTWDSLVAGHITSNVTLYYQP
jgi:type II secretory pathway pseudopilin PulG